MLINELSNIIQDVNRVIYEKNIEHKYLSDNLGRKQGQSSALVFPVSTQEVSAVLRFAYENSIPVTPRGGWNKSCGQHDSSRWFNYFRYVPYESYSGSGC